MQGEAAALAPAALVSGPGVRLGVRRGVGPGVRAGPCVELGAGVAVPAEQTGTESRPAVELGGEVWDKLGAPATELGAEASDEVAARGQAPAADPVCSVGWGGRLSPVNAGLPVRGRSGA